MTAMTDDERYAAIRARDTRFDGMFFTCVRSTGIFCRPSCPARTPRRDGVEFVPSAAAAVAAGYRACKRCGPTAPPGSPDADPAGTLAGRALRLIEQGALDEHGSVPALARRLAVSERTLHRALVDRTGAGALAHARLRRARRAHELVAGSDVPLATVAHAAGFGSERQFHDTFSRIYGHAPSVVRERARRAAAPEDRASADRARAGGSASPGSDGAVLTARLAVRRPFDGAGLADWLAHRAVEGVESLEDLRWTRALSLPHGPALAQVDLAADGPLPLTLHLADLRDHAAAIALLRRLLDLDADPVGIDEGLAGTSPALAGLVADRPGVRLPGLPDLGEALLWAITGQQITTAQAREQITRATDLHTEELPAGMRSAGVHRLPVDPVLAAASAAEWFRGPGARREALAVAVPAAQALDPTLPVGALREELLALRGVGPWTADYALLRTVRAVDLSPARDAALLAAARDLGLAEDHPGLQASLAAASPWRSYATLHLWHHQASLRGDRRPHPAPRTGSTDRTNHIDRADRRVRTDLPPRTDLPEEGPRP
ncbi:Ada metal-binding domain-containing protein [Brachybacterium aquaticum]|uniref:AraC family transcriptional regulator of adaptative response / DNA-3-methyladenine glycosylase II n=1 Tax=Brachybacterium aquaticum TaxID=1432564 RepID=A0A841ABC6_9MICO|nr:Ada metal-binding domain-containing protein [Brachybacterium aquaticum]MBB5832136.1 AraC family transcriptional regulator of adaptative response / DNA-3-methyladenine glycosylase II [Brachybacterium aquaticum]